MPTVSARAIAAAPAAVIGVLVLTDVVQARYRRKLLAMADASRPPAS